MEEKPISAFLAFTPSTEQTAVLEDLQDFLKSSTDDFLILDGSAGTGKTTLIAACTAYLSHNKIPYHLAAPTGRAARILSAKAKVFCTTIHSLIYNVNADASTGMVHFALKENEEKGATVYIIDEASMIPSNSNIDEASLFTSNSPVLEDLIRFIKDGHHINKVIFVGDKNQLPPVKEEFSAALSAAYLQENFNLEGTYLKLKDVKRQNLDSPIFSFVDHLKQGLEDGKPISSSRNFFKVEKQWTAEYQYVSDYTNHGPDYCTAIAAAHKINISFNRNVRSLLFDGRPERLLPSDLLMINRTIKKDKYTLYNGDHVTVRSADLEKIVRIGELEFCEVELISTSISGKEICIKDYLLLTTLENPRGLTPKQEKTLRHHRFTNNEKYRKSGNPMDDFYLSAIRAIYGYSITIHKAQGGEWEKVYICDWYPNNSLKHQYTAFTRARKEVFVY